MAIADIFRPKHKHSKSEVRAAAVAAMSKKDVDLLVEVASADVDASIRRSAISKIADPEALASVAADQDDGKLRDYATSLAVDIWVAKAISSEDLAEAKVAFNHAAAHGGDRALGEIAGQAQLAEVRSQALARLEDDRALGQVVRKAQRAEEWKEALSRISDSSILRSIAIDEKRKQVAFAALDKIDDAGLLDEVAGKAKNKSVRAKAKRSRAALSKNKPAASGQSDEDKRVIAERTQLVRQVQQAAGGDDWLAARATVDESQRRWLELGECEDAKLSKRFDKACARFESDYASHGKAAAEALARREREEAAAAAAAEEAAKPAPPPLQEVESAPSTEEESPAEAVPSEREAKSAQDEDQRLDNQDELERLCETLEELVDNDKLRGFDRTLKDTDKLRRKIGPLPRNAADALRERYDEARRKAVIRLGELREADEWKRWATVPKMEALVEKAKVLLADTEHKKLGDALKGLQKEWRELGAAPREKGDELWKVFKATCDEVYERVKAQRDTRNTEQAENLAKKEALCVRAEELQSSTDWKETSAAFKELQSQWKQIGPVPRRKSDGLWKRFRGACDAFFEARAPHFEEQQSELEDNLEAKQSLIKEIEELASADGEVEEQIDAVRSLQRRWRDIGKVAHRVYEELNESYKAACDKVYAKREAAEEAARAAERALVTDLEEQIVECSDAGWDSDAAEVARKVLDIRTRYLQMESTIEGRAELGVKVEALIRSQLEAEPDAYKGSVLDLDRSKEAYEALISKAEELAPQEEEAVDDKNPEEMAEKLRAALADRALGGVLSKDVGPSAQERVAALRLEWEGVAPVPGVAGTALKERFEAACQLATGGNVGSKNGEQEE
jgi:hypothetical protein